MLPCGHGQLGANWSRSIAPGSENCRVDTAIDCDYLHTPCIYICYIIHSVHSKHCEAGTLETTIIKSAVGMAGSHSVLYFDPCYARATVVRARFLAAAFSDGSYLAHVNGAYLRHVTFCIVSPISQHWRLPRLVQSPPASPILV